jgi:hypothetical protein
MDSIGRLRNGDETEANPPRLAKFIDETRNRNNALMKACLSSPLNPTLEVLIQKKTSTLILAMTGLMASMRRLLKTSMLGKMLLQNGTSTFNVPPQRKIDLITVIASCRDFLPQDTKKVVSGCSSLRIWLSHSKIRG